MKYATEILDAVYAHLTEELDYLRKWKENATEILDELSAEHDALEKALDGEPELFPGCRPTVAAMNVLHRLRSVVEIMPRLRQDRDEALAEAERLRAMVDAGAVAWPPEDVLAMTPAREPATVTMNGPAGYAEAVRNARRIAGDEG